MTETEKRRHTADGFEVDGFLAAATEVEQTGVRVLESAIVGSHKVDVSGGKTN